MLKALQKSVEGFPATDSCNMSCTALWDIVVSSVKVGFVMIADDVISSQ